MKMNNYSQQGLFRKLIPNHISLFVIFGYCQKKFGQPYSQCSPGANCSEMQLKGTIVCKGEEIHNLSELTAAGKPPQEHNYATFERVRVLKSQRIL